MRLNHFLNFPTNCCCCCSYESLSSFKTINGSWPVSLCTSSHTVLLISSVVFTGTGTMWYMLPPWLSILKRKFCRPEETYFQVQILPREVFWPLFVTNMKTSILKTTAVEALNTNLNQKGCFLKDLQWNHSIKILFH